MGINGTKDNTMVVIGGVVILVAISVAGIVAITLGRSDQAGIIIPLLLTLVSTTVVGMLALVRSNKSVETAQKSVEIAQEVAVKTQTVAERLDGKLTAFIEAASKVAHDQGFREAMAQIKADAAIHALGKAEGVAESKVPNAPDKPQDVTMTVDSMNVNATAVEIRAPEKKAE